MAEALCVGHEQIVVGAECAKHRHYEGGVEEGGVDTGDEHRVGPITDGDQSGFHTTQRALFCDAIAGELDAVGERWDALVGSRDGDDGTRGRLLQRRSQMGGERQAVPVNVGLGRTHACRTATEEQNRAH